MDWKEALRTSENSWAEAPPIRAGRKAGGRDNVSWKGLAHVSNVSEEYFHTYVQGIENGWRVIGPAAYCAGGEVTKCPGTVGVYRGRTCRAKADTPSKERDDRGSAQR